MISSHNAGFVWLDNFFNDLSEFKSLMEFSIASLSSDLSFHFGDTVQDPLLVNTRDVYHQKAIASLSQNAFIAQSISLVYAALNKHSTSTTRHLFKIAIILPDILPLDGEHQCRNFVLLLLGTRITDFLSSHHTIRIWDHFTCKRDARVQQTRY